MCITGAAAVVLFGTTRAIISTAGLLLHYCCITAAVQLAVLELLLAADLCGCHACATRLIRCGHVACIVSYRDEDIGV